MKPKDVSGKFAELTEEELTRVVGGDAAHYDSMAEQCLAEMQNCIEQNLDAQFYRDTMTGAIQASVDRGCLTENEVQELWTLVEDYSRRLRTP